MIGPDDGPIFRTSHVWGRRTDDAAERPTLSTARRGPPGPRPPGLAARAPRVTGRFSTTTTMSTVGAHAKKHAVSLQGALGFLGFDGFPLET